jgi:hypothetical protein
LVFLAASAAAVAAPSDNTWMTVLLDGRKIGNMHLTRSVQGDHVITTQALSIELARTGIKVGLSSRETDTETRDGTPIGFESRSSISGIESVITGKVHDDGTCEVTTNIGGNPQTRTIMWPKGALLAEGLRLAEAKTSLNPGGHFSELAFQAESLDAVEVATTVGASERIDLPEGARKLIRIEQLIELPGAPTKSIAWINSDQDIQKMTMSVMGYELTMLACSQSCAQAPNQSADILTHALAPAPSALTPDDLHRGVIIRMSSTQADAPLSFVSTDEQRVTKVGNGAELRIAPISADSNDSEGAPQPADSKPNDWLQSDALEVRKLAQLGAGDAKDPLAQMQNLESFVRGFIRDKNLSVGYASALEVAKNPEGDCTEHAVLLAALGRSLGIPTRVVDGLAYTNHYAGVDHVFVPHAWAQAWVGGKWQSFDAALLGFDAGHIALSVGDGDPWRFFAGLETLGRMKVDSVAPLQPNPQKSN